MNSITKRQFVILVALFPLGPALLVFIRLLTNPIWESELEALMAIGGFCLIPGIFLIAIALLTILIQRKRPDNLPKIVAIFPIVGTFLAMGAFFLTGYFWAQGKYGFLSLLSSLFFPTEEVLWQIRLLISLLVPTLVGVIIVYLLNIYMLRNTPSTAINT